MSELNDLKSVRDKFDTKRVHYVPEVLENEVYASNKELVRRNQTVIALLSKVVAVVDLVKEYTTIQKLLTAAEHYIHMQNVAEQVKIAKDRLRLANRAKVWAKSKKKRVHLSDGVESRYVEAFNEAISTAILELNKDTAKRRGTYFQTLKHTIFDNLPLDIPKEKKTILREAPVLVFLHDGAKIQGKTSEQVQDNLHLIRNAKVLGVKRGIRMKFADIEAIAVRKGKCTLFPRSIPKSGSNLDWYLLLDFSAEITNASFVSSMQLPGYNASDAEGMSLEQYAWVAKKQQEQRAKVATRIQRELRETFEKEEAYSYEQLRYYRNMYDIYAEAETYWEVEFAQLTSLDGSSERGLTPDKYSHIEAFFEEFMQVKMSEFDATNDTRLGVLQQRVDARYAYFCHKAVREKLRFFRANIKVIRKDIEDRRAAMAKQFGSVSRLIDDTIRNDPTLLEVDGK